MALAAKQRTASKGQMEKSHCRICTKEVKTSHKALACEICELWYHVECHGKVPLQLYELLIEEGSNLHWYCDSCNGAVAQIYKMVCSVQTRQDAVEVKVDKMSDNLDNLKSNFKASIDSRLDEREDRARREQNLILFNVEETEENEEELIKVICTDVLKVAPPLISKSMRLGKKSEKARPLCVVVPDRESRIDILKNSRALKDSKYDKIIISRDYTVEQRDTNRKLRQDLADIRQKDPSEKYVIRRGQVVKWSESKGPSGASGFQK
jgi:hypothetical protein